MNRTQVVSRSLDLIPWWLRKRIKSIPIVAWVQRWVVNRLLRGREFPHQISAGPARGLRFRVRLPEDKLYWTGTWEPDVTTTLASQVTSGAVCYDIGSHRGFMAGVMAMNGAGRVICFEPNPDNAATVRDLILLNPSLSIEVLPYAVGAENARAEFVIMPESSMGKLSTSTFQHAAGRDRSIEVDIRTLDGLTGTGQVPPPQLIKMDIEGAEFDALRGAERTIGAHHPVMLIEVHSFGLLEQCRDWLTERGYQLTTLQQPMETITAERFSVCHLLAQPR